MIQSEPQEIVVTTKNTASLILGIISIIVGVFALLFGWIPLLGLLAIPVAIIGTLLALMGTIIAIAKSFKGISIPIIGIIICVISFIIPLLSTGTITKSIDETMQKVELQKEKQSEDKIRQEQMERIQKESYISNYLDLYDVKARYMNSFYDREVPGVLFKIRNKGNKSLSKVEVTVYFKDAKGIIITEEKYYPIYVTEYSLTDGNKPLKSGYIWQMESGMFYSAKSVPSEWQEGSVDVKITDIQFSE